ncbi:MAG TPA: efflux RND transporter periplasmic adaptor subunit [Candidatus Latescibacteria bacterium]|nr:efflux RND transporter periplasmic adaptor subunit [Candidatus Latescibacterota bacterium]
MADSSTPTPIPQKGDRRILRAVVPLAIVIAASLVAYYLMKTAPRAERRQRPVNARLVEVDTLHFAEHVVTIEAMGTVEPAQEVQVAAPVAGEVLNISPELIPGGRLRKGQLLVQIDPADYDFAVERAAAEVTRARSELATEMGKQAVARREFELLGQQGGEAERALALRQPQLETARAALASAEAALAQARLNRRRTSVSAPFNAVVKVSYVNVGARVSANAPLAALMGTDEYWVMASVPVNQLRWISVPRSATGKGSPAVISNDVEWGSGVVREGYVARVAGDLEEQGRMARVLISVPDPLALTRNNEGKPSLLVGSYVRVAIRGNPVPSAAKIRRDLLREGDRVWIMNDSSRLEIRPVTIALKSPDAVYVTGGVREGERIVTTDLSAAVEGQPLRTREEPPARNATRGTSR